MKNIKKTKKIVEKHKKIAFRLRARFLRAGGLCTRLLARSDPVCVCVLVCLCVARPHTPAHYLNPRETRAPTVSDQIYAANRGPIILANALYPS